MKYIGFRCVAIVIIVSSTLLGLPDQPACAVVSETLKLLPNDSAAGDNFGNSVAVSGGRAIVGSPGNGAVGAAYLFDATTGLQLFKLLPDNLATVSHFGGSVAASGGIALVNATAIDGTGRVYVFDITNGSQLGILSADDAAPGDGFGRSLAIHGTTALIGAPLDDNGFDNAGSAYLFDTVTGSQLKKFVAALPAEDDRLGDSVAFDGGFAVISALTATDSPDFLLFDPSTGNQVARVDGTDSSTTGSSLATSGDRVLMGSPSIFNAAIAGLFDISDVNNIITTPLPWPGDSLQGHFFGDSVALNDQFALLSTWFSGLGDTGIVYLFDPDSGAVLDSFRPSGTPTDDRFGDAIGLFGQTLIVGAPGQGLADAGAAYLFTIPEPASLAVCLVLGAAVLKRGTRRSSVAH